MAEITNRKNTETRLSRMETIPMMTAAITPARRKVKAIAAKQKAAEEYTDEKET